MASKTLHVFLPLCFLVGACSYLSEDEGRIIRDDVARLKGTVLKLEKQTADLKKVTSDLDPEVARMRSAVDEATKIVTRNSADLGLTVQKMQIDVAALSGRLDDIQSTLALTKKTSAPSVPFDAQSAAQPAAKASAIPDTADGIFTEAQRFYDNKQYSDARRLFESFLARYPTERRVDKVQYLTGETYFKENRFANAIGAFTKLIDNFPKSEMVPDAMYYNGTAFYSLKYCSDAKVYFQELLKRYPKTEWREDVNTQLKKLQKDMKNKSLCVS